MVTIPPSGSVQVQAHNLRAFTALWVAIPQWWGQGSYPKSNLRDFTALWVAIPTVVGGKAPTHNLRAFTALLVAIG